ncbi:MAG: lipoate--protein ligase family protein [Nitrososphaeria archaeon]
MWRLIVNEGTAHHCMALDEALMMTRSKNQTDNILRLYVFKPSAVTIGYFQKIEETIDMEYVNELGIPVVRRITGGGAVYHDQYGEITYSVVSSLTDFSSDVQQSYRDICQGIVYALEDFGLKAEFVPVNDVVVGARKISGSAQTRKNKALLQHGTFMYNTDIEKLGKLFKVPREKLAAHSVGSIYDRVTTVSRELGRTVTRDQATSALIRGFSRAFQANLQPDKLTEAELELTMEIEKKYVSRNWNFRR